MLGGYYLGQLYLGISGLPSAGILSVVPSSHQLTSDNITLTQKQILVIDSAAHSLTSQNVTLTQKHLLAVDNAVHTLMSENVAITSEQLLGINDAFHGLISTTIGLTQKHTLVVNNTTHGHTAANLDLVEHKTLTVANALHGHTAQSPAIVVHFYLVVQNAAHGHTSANIGLTQKQLLVVANTTHGTTSTVIAGLINIQPYGLGGGFGAVDGFAIAQYGAIDIELPLNFYIIPGNNYHTVTDNLNGFSQKHNIVAANTTHAQTTNNLDLWQIYFRYGGAYIKGFEEEGEVGSEYAKSTGTNIVESGHFGQITPVSEQDNGFLIVKIGTSGTYAQNDIDSGTLLTGNSGSGNLTPEVEDTGNYIKSNN